jgi:starvation-inducible outer membrane lipoprotein
MKYLLTLFLFVLTYVSEAQLPVITTTVSDAQLPVIKTTEAKDYVGKEVLLEGKIVRIKHHQTEQTGLFIVFVDLDKSYPANDVGVTIYESNFIDSGQDESKLYGKMVQIRGTIITYKDKYKLQVNHKEKITL